MGSPPFADEDRRDRPTLTEEDTQGGRSESKLQHKEAATSVSASECWNFGPEPHVEDVSHVNAQVARLINVLGETGAGRRAVLKAVAMQQGINDEDELEKLYSGTSTKNK